MYKPKITLAERYDKISVWVTYPDGKDINIWDLEEKEATKNVLNAIASAFERGMKASFATIDEVVKKGMWVGMPDIDMEVEHD